MPGRALAACETSQGRPDERRERQERSRTGHGPASPVAHLSETLVDDLRLAVEVLGMLSVTTHREEAAQLGVDRHLGYGGRRALDRGAE